jgi:hypothetical protein
MSTKLQIVAIIVSSGLLLVVLELVRRRRLVERYALLWLASAATLLLLSAWNGLLDSISDWVGIATPANALFAIAFGFVLVLLLHFSTAISRLSEENKVLAQEAARLDRELRERRGDGRAGEGEREGTSAAERERASAGPRAG